MPSSNTIESPGIPMIEAVAGLDAAASVLIALAGNHDTTLSDFFTRLAWELKSVSLGDGRQDDEDPMVVKITARSEELAGEALSEFGMIPRAERHLETARRMRATGSTDAEPDDA